MIDLISGLKVTDKTLRNQVGKSRSWFYNLRSFGNKSLKYVILDANDEVLNLFKLYPEVPVCTLDIREKGIVISFYLNKMKYVLPMPFYALTVFKGSDYLQVYGGKWRVKLGNEINESLNHSVIRKILLMKHEAVSCKNDYYG